METSGQRAWDEAASFYSRVLSAVYEPVTASFVEFCGFRPGQRVLDVACGPGSVTALAADRTAPAGSVVGIDRSAEMIRIARYRTTGLRNIEFTRMDAERLEFDDGSFDAAVSQLALMYFDHPDRALSEMTRVVRAGGSVACLVPGRRERMVLIELASRVLAKHVPNVDAWAPKLYAFASERALETAFRSAGHKVVDCRRFSGAFHFDSPESFLRVVSVDASMVGQALKTLDERLRATVEAEILFEAGRFRSGFGVDIPFEFTMARATKER